MPEKVPSVLRVQQDLPAKPVAAVLQDRVVLQVELERPGLPAQLDQLALLDPWDQLEVLVQQGLVVRLEDLVRVV